MCVCVCVYTYALISYRILFIDGHRKVILAHILAATSIGIISAAVIHYRKRRSKPSKHQNIAPQLDLTQSGRVGRLERFSQYVGNSLLQFF